MASIATAVRQHDAPVYSGADDFAALLESSLGMNAGFEGSVVTGTVLRIDDDFVIVDVGLKSEGRVPLREFAPMGAKPEVNIGDVFDLYIERYEDKGGSMVLSREKARREES
ncbi:MAG: 30S ribosomal protein S1, partial [Acidocella sp. 20-61-6]